jgi:hypothetical protein
MPFIPRAQVHMPVDFEGYGSSTVGPANAFDGNYALELKAGSATSTAFPEFCSLIGCAIEVALRAPTGGLAALSGSVEVVRIADGVSDYYATMKASAAGLEFLYTTIGSVVIAHTLVATGDMPAFDTPGMWYISANFHDVTPGIRGFTVYVDGVLVLQTAVVTMSTPLIPQPPLGTSYALTLAGSPTEVLRVSGVRIWNQPRTPAQVADLAYRTVEVPADSAGTLEHEWLMQTNLFLDTVGGSPLALFGQATRVRQNMQPGFVGYTPWSNPQPLQFFTAAAHAERRMAARRWLQSTIRDASAASAMLRTGAADARPTPGAMSAMFEARDAVAVLGTLNQMRWSCPPGEALQGTTCVDLATFSDTDISNSHLNDDDDDDDAMNTWTIVLFVALGLLLAAVLILACCWAARSIPGLVRDETETEYRARQAREQRRAAVRQTTTTTETTHVPAGPYPSYPGAGNWAQAGPGAAPVDAGTTYEFTAPDQGAHSRSDGNAYARGASAVVNQPGASMRFDGL